MPLNRPAVSRVLRTMIALPCKLLTLFLALALALPTGWCCTVEASTTPEPSEHRSCCHQQDFASVTEGCCQSDQGQPAMECCCQRLAATLATAVECDAPADAVAIALPDVVQIAGVSNGFSSSLVLWPEIGTARQARLCVWRL